MAHFAHQLTLGAQLLDQQKTRFSIWAPDVDSIALDIVGREPLPMERNQEGIHSCTAPCGAGTPYRYHIEPDLLVPDPASRMQQEDVQGPSVVVDPFAYKWREHQWRGRPWHEMVIYEVHVGCLGGFAALETQLQRLADLGITAIELMPVADFAGERNWGYDGVLPYAPDRAYGTPAELKHLIDTAHGCGLCIYLDVVYNHFGPEGNYLHQYASPFFSPEVSSPWGAAINFSEPRVREFFTENALYWLMEYRFDGLRFDAVHAISDPDWLDEMAARVRATVEPGRQVHLMLENERNRSSHLEADFDAQWNDDIHNCVHVLLTGEHEGYYQNYCTVPTDQLARALAEGFAYQGEASPSHNNRPRGMPSGHLPLHKFVFFLQNHDQVGNRALGERLTSLTKPDALRAAITLQLLSPQIPLLFMGEERGLKTPFLFFTDFHGELAEAVRQGRRDEFKAFSHFADASAQAAIPDPNSPDTFARSREQLDPNIHAGAVPDQDGQVHWEKFYRQLLQLRHRHIIPHLPRSKAVTAVALGHACVLAAWVLAEGLMLRLIANLGDADCELGNIPGELVFESRTGAGKMAAAGISLASSTSVFIEDVSGRGTPLSESPHKEIQAGETT
jgi:maltooligosyltrehalose trehalohydrolase